MFVQLYMNNGYDIVYLQRKPHLFIPRMSGYYSPAMDQAVLAMRLKFGNNFEDCTLRGARGDLVSLEIVKASI